MSGLPTGFTLDQPPPQGIPNGFALDQPQQRKGFLSDILPQRNLSPQARSAVQDAQARPWGSGQHHLSYKAGEKVADFATNAGASPEVAAGAGYGANVLTGAVPAFLGAAGASSAVQNTGRGLMQSAVKPILPDQQSGDAARGIETLLKHGYNPTKGGVEALQQRISQLGDEVTQALSSSTATINKNAVADRLRSAVDKFKSQVNPKADLEAIQNAWTEFLAHPDLAGKLDMPVQLAQKLKQGTYAILGNKPYGELSGAATESQKQLARGLKEEVSAAVPGVEKANTLQGDLINAKDIAQRRALMEGNKNPVSLPTSLGVVAHDPMATLGLWANTSAYAKSLAARMLYSGSHAPGGAAGTALGAQSGRPPTEAEMLAESLRKKKPPPEQFLSPEDASIPLAYRMR